MSDFITKIKKTTLFGGDILALYLALYLTIFIRYRGNFPSEGAWHVHAVTFTWVFAIWLIVFYISDFYNLKGSYTNGGIFNSLWRPFLINSFLAVAVFYFFAPFLAQIRPQRILIIDVGFSIILFFIWRKIFYSLINSSKIANKVLILGDSPIVKELINTINNQPQLGYHGFHISELPADLKNYCQENKINTLISAQDLKSSPWASRAIFDCLPLGIDVYNLTSFYEQITGKVPVEYIEHSWFLENLAEHSKKLYELSKRITDIVIATIGLIVAIFLAPFIAIIIKLESRGPVIFKQIRVGKNGKDFLAMKFRSMVADAEKNGPQWATKNDSRVTRFGKFMRKTRLDEIPQLINILKGEMSFVGPRPERPEFVKVLTSEIPFYQERLMVKPGLTGWAQLYGPAYGGSKEESLEKVKYDLFYIKNRSLILDLSIILKTIKLVISKKGQ